MATLLELAQQIVMAHTSTTQMSSKEMIQEIQEVYAALQAIEKGQAIPADAPGVEDQQTPAITKRKAFGKDKVTCMICGKQMKTLARHLGTEHGLKPSEYRKQFDIPRTQPLAAKSYSESRKQMAIERGLGENLAKARAVRAKKEKEADAKKTASKKTASKKTGGKKAGSVPAE